MKRIVAVSLLILCTSFLGAQNQDSTSFLPNFITNYYAGALSVNSINTRIITADNQLRIGICAEKVIVKGFSSRLVLWYNPQTNQKINSDLRLIYTIKDFKVMVGLLPSVTRMFHAPQPLSSVSQYSPTSQNIISLGMKPGATLSWKNLFSGVYVGAKDYTNAQDSLEFHIGFCRYSKTSWLAVFKASAYTTNYHGLDDRIVIGGAVTAQINSFAFTAFAEKGNHPTYSFSSNYEVKKDLNLFFNILYEDDKDLEKKERCTFSEVGILKTVHWKVFSYAYGVAYSHNPDPTLQLVVQVFIGE